MPRGRKKAVPTGTDTDVLENGVGIHNITGTEDGADSLISKIEPIRIFCKIEGTADMLMHRWNAEYVDMKAAAKKNSEVKKTDDPEKFISRNEKGEVAIPGEYVRMAICTAAKSIPDPRSPRKSMMDLAKAAFVIEEKLLSLNVRKWDYIDKRRVVVQRAGINRSRPAMYAGWKLSFHATIFQSEYLPSKLFHQLISMAGSFVGLADFRPSYGRFQIIEYKVLKDTTKIEN